MALKIVQGRGKNEEMKTNWGGKASPNIKNGLKINQRKVISNSYLKKKKKKP